MKKFFSVLLLFTIAITLVSCGSGDGHGTTAESSAVKGANVPQTNNSTKESTAASGDKGTDEGPKQAEVPGSNFNFPAAGTRPIAVMIDNEGTRSLPQGGLDKAQVIYEILVEGGETRLMPLFWNEAPEMIGSVRSSRHYFIDYAMEHDAIYVHFGWSPMAMRDISKFKINNINGVANGGEIFWDLTKDKNNWQDSYTSMENIRNYVKKVKYRTDSSKEPVFSYSKSDAEPVDGQKAVKISLRYSEAYTCGFVYDDSKKSYLRLRKGQPQIERTSGQQLTAKNIVIQNVETHTIKGDDAGRQELKDVGSGHGWYITMGKAIKIKWLKRSRESATKYSDEKGNRVTLNPGSTWVQVLPISGKTSIE